MLRISGGKSRKDIVWRFMVVTGEVILFLKAFFLLMAFVFLERFSLFESPRLLVRMMSGCVSVIKVVGGT